MNRLPNIHDTIKLLRRNGYRVIKTGEDYRVIYADGDTANYNTHALIVAAKYIIGKYVGTSVRRNTKHDEHRKTRARERDHLNQHQGDVMENDFYDEDNSSVTPTRSADIWAWS